VVGGTGDVQPELLDGGEHGEVQLAPPDLGQIGLDCPSGQLVAEGEEVILQLENTGRLTFGDGIF
jgi:hypothetical protein